MQLLSTPSSVQNSPNYSTYFQTSVSPKVIDVGIKFMKVGIILYLESIPNHCII